MPEILDAYTRDGLFFGVVRVIVSAELVMFEFGIDVSGYTAIRRILQSHPFESTPGTKYRYFFAGDYSRPTDKDIVTFAVRVEQGQTAKKFDFDGPRSLVSNLLWFQRLKAIDEAKHLRRLDGTAVT